MKEEKSIVEGAHCCVPLSSLHPLGPPVSPPPGGRAGGSARPPPPPPRDPWRWRGRCGRKHTSSITLRTARSTANSGGGGGGGVMLGTAGEGSSRTSNRGSAGITQRNPGGLPPFPTYPAHPTGAGRRTSAARLSAWVANATWRRLTGLRPSGGPPGPPSAAVRPILHHCG